mmetsp:Transcript_28020/g.77084  ORF Transcript_28020/g.77084 Transcript_28020/m.77084 type:complete len:110 (-) Transcript_28020:381-710(-)
MVLKLKLPALYIPSAKVPSAKVRLLSTSNLLTEYQGETVTQTSHGMNFLASMATTSDILSMYLSIHFTSSPCHSATMVKQPQPPRRLLLLPSTQLTIPTSTSLRLRRSL